MSDDNSITLKLFTTIIKELGVFPFIGVAIVYLLIFVASEEQQREIIDRYILFKADDAFAIIVVVTILLIIIVVGGFMSSVRLSLYKREIKRLEEMNEILRS